MRPLNNSDRPSYFSLDQFSETSSGEQTVSTQLEPLEPRVLLSSTPLITEFMAKNDTTLADENGDFSDWIEIHNPTDNAISLNGWSLTDDATALSKWSFPDVTLDSGDYLLVFASGKDRAVAGQEFHTNFSLNAAGEYLALVQPDGLTIAHDYTSAFPEQRPDISFGLAGNVTTLIEAASPVAYWVPTDDSLGATWTTVAFDDSTWTNATGEGNASVVITELGLGNPDWIEIQNVSTETVDTTGWRVAFNRASNSNINDVHSFLWEPGNSMSAGQVLQTNDNSNGLGNISWDDDLPGWAMILDDTGQITDYMVWGYDATQIATLDVTINGFHLIAADLPWSDAGLPLVNNVNYIRRTGNTDSDLATDFIYSSSSDSGSQNDVLTVPFADSSPIPTHTGVGYDTDIGGIGQQLNLAPNGVATQSSTLSGFVASLGNDGNFGNFTHTLASTDLPATWELDLGDIFVLEQINLHNRDGCCQSRLRDITVTILDADGVTEVWSSALLNPENVLAGPAVIEVDIITLNGSSVVGRYVRVVRTPDPDLSGTGGAGNNDEADVLSLGEVEVLGRETISYNSLINAPVPVGTTSVYTRQTFNVDNPTDLNNLTLRMRYDDGFVAYLNGIEVARRNAPANPLYNATATDEHPDEQAVVFEEINISQHMGALQDGANVLAIHSLNKNASSSDFLIEPELIASSTSASQRYFDVATPGATNSSGFIDFVADTTFSVDRGFYDAPFQLEITSLTSDAIIRYTTNGAEPTATTGFVYTSPLTIDRTTAIRAAAFKTGYQPTNVDTQTYLFIHDVVNQNTQSTLDAGFPSSWGSYTADYGMDPDVIGTFDADGNSLGGDLFGGVYASTIQEALIDIPTMSIVADMDDLFGSDGIYTNSTQRGSYWERATSIEYILPDGSPGFQEDAGLRIQGGAFRSDGLSKKHSFRLLFRKEYGVGKLEYPLFEAGAAEKFDTIVLRAGANDGYTWNAAKLTEQYIRDEFGRSLQRATGNPSAHGNFVHLYVNGVYWGLYNPVERPDNDFSASYFGGDDENWDAIHVGEATQGDFVAWDAMLAQSQLAGVSMTEYMQLQGLNPDGTDHATVSPLLDVQNYADYIISNVWGGNWDWPWKNWWAGRDRNDATTTGFKFYNWDFENTMGNNRSRSPLNATTLDQNFTGSRNAGQPHTSLISNDEYRILFADRVHQFFFNEGVLTPDNLTNRYQNIADQVELSIIGESARWGDMHYSTPLTLAEWTTERDWILNAYLPQRSAIVLQELKNYNLYPETDAPSFNQHGGSVGSGFELLITKNESGGTIYYTLDGSDPRLQGGAISSTALVYNPANSLIITLPTMVKARLLRAGQWSAVNQALFTIGIPADATNLRVTEIHYNPTGATATEIAAGFDDGDMFEFIELLNSSATQTLDLSGVKFSNGIAFSFDIGTSLLPGERIVAVSNQAAFEARYGTGVNVAGVYAGKISNSGEAIKLDDSTGSTIQSFEYNDNDNWPGRADGDGSSLVVVDIAGNYDSGDNWDSSLAYNGTPGTAPLNRDATILVNEVLAHTDLPQRDAIELHNLTGAAIDISGWYLSDSTLNYLKYRINDNTILGSNSYIAFDENDFNPGDGANATDFALSEFGDDVYLLAADASGKPIRFVDHVSFGATANGVALGRVNNNTNKLFPLAQNNFGQANGEHQVGTIVISEINYNPKVPAGSSLTSDQLEFVELHNPTGLTVDLEGYRISGGIGLAFTAGTTLNAGETVLAVSFDPAVDTATATSFRDAYGIDGTVKLIGPYAGVLDNGGETVKIQFLMEEGLSNGQALVDRVIYDDDSPWPIEADGTGNSLQRTVIQNYGDDSASWLAEVPTPGTVPQSIILGDINGDGLVNGFDVDPFVNVLLNGPYNAAADMNSDGAVNGFDVDPFVNAVLSGSSAPAPVEEETPAEVEPVADAPAEQVVVEETTDTAANAPVIINNFASNEPQETEEDQNNNLTPLIKMLPVVELV